MIVLWLFIFGLAIEIKLAKIVKKSNNPLVINRLFVN